MVADDASDASEPEHGFGVGAGGRTGRDTGRDTGAVPGAVCTFVSGAASPERPGKQDPPPAATDARRTGGTPKDASPKDATPKDGAGTDGTCRPALRDRRSRAELYRRAHDAGIVGRSEMSRAELAAALRARGGTSP